MRVDNGERAIARIEIGDEPARLECHRHLSFKAQLLLDDDVGVGEGLVRLALLQRKIEGDVVAKLGMDDRRARCDRLQLIADRGQGLPFDRDKLGRVLGFGAALGHHDGHRLALPDRPFRRQQMLRRRAMPRPVQRHADERLAFRIDVGRGEDGGDAGRILGGGNLDRDDLGVRMRAAHEAGVQHAGQLDVVDVAAVPAEQALELPPRDARSDAGRRCCVCVHQILPRRPITASTASTMA